ncbi:MAG: DNA repair protein RadC [Anaerolineae bacterium]|nr:DNA repair protein RadC [Anaerolineae bacterium]
MSQDSPYRRLRDLAVEEQPLSRLNQVGAAALATSELLALLLGCAPDLGSDLLCHFGSLHRLARAPRSRLMQRHGIGRSQAARLHAVAELARRLQAPPQDERQRINSPADAANLLMPSMRHLQQEHLSTILLDTRNGVLGIETIYVGSLNSSVVRIGEIFRPAIEAPAAAIIIAHNHPSSDASPSPQDVRVTREVCKAGKLLSIELLDHLVIGDGSWVSLKERSLGFD